MMTIIVSFDRINYAIPHSNSQSGLSHFTHHQCIVVSFTTHDGVEWTLKQEFENSVAGEILARKVAIRVQARINASGTETLNSEYWNRREYSEEESYFTDHNHSDMLISHI